MTMNEYHDLITESRNVYARSILREQVSNFIAETILIIEKNIHRELTQDEIENILIHLIENEDTN
jgi:hypothetical protein